MLTVLFILILSNMAVCNFVKYRSTVAHWYVICFSPGGPGFKSRQGRELLILNKKEFNNLNTIIVWVYEKWIMVSVNDD